MVSDHGSSHVFERLWRWIRRLIAAVILTFLVSSVPFAGAAQADPGVSLKAERERSVDVAPVKPRPASSSQSDHADWSPEPVRWPSAGASTVSLAAGARTAVERQPVRIGRAPTAAAARAAAIPVDEVTSEVLSQAQSKAAGVSGPMLRLSRSDGVAAAGAVSVEFDYSSLRQASGGNWARRLQLVQLPACAALTPALPECQTATPVPSRNDLSRSTLTADVAVTGAAPDATGTATVLAVTSMAASADTGTFAKSGLQSSASWAAGMPSGDFAWSYPMEVPPAPGGLEPEVALSYSSGRVDGRTNAENAQPSWLGEGWDYEPGYIERSYRACKDDVTGATAAQYTNATDDLCYRDQNAVLVWNGISTELVLDDATGTWRLADDDGSRIELVTGGAGTLNHNNEHWKLTAPDGTQYWFGKTRLPGWQSTSPITASVWGVPVFHNRSAEPCYKTGGFAGSWCSMAWRWNLDYVVDPHGNSMSYWYQKETSTTKLAGSTTVKGYDRGGWLKRIEYGTRAGTELSTTAPMKVEFTPGDRCVSSCYSGSTPVQANWPDTPWDLQCNAAPCNNNPTPSFWTAVRLAKVTTSVKGTPVDEWALTHQLPATGDTTSPSLWLSTITRTGKTGGTKTLPKVDFGGTRNANRTDFNTTTAVPPTNKYRITRITDETGGETLIAYEGSDCTVSSQANPDSNTKRCFPQYYTPPQAAPGWAWWNKYRVKTVTERDLVGGSPNVVHTYGYGTTSSTTAVLWHHNDLGKWALPLPKRTWSDWRGYSDVTVTTGASGTATKELYRYFRGLHADRTDAGETARTASIVDSHGASWQDSNARAGFLLEHIEYDADGTTARYKSRNQPWHARTALRAEHPDHAQPTTTEAGFTGTARAETFEYLAGTGTWRENEVDYTYDPTYGQLVGETDRGLVGSTNDDVCTTISYARNTTAWLIDYPAEELTTNCAATPGPDDVLAGERTYYDTLPALGAAPERGLATRTDELDSYSGTTATWLPTATTTYDSHGRVLDDTDALNRTTKTRYTPAAGGPVTAVQEINAAEHTTTSTLDVRGNTTAETDPNGKTTTAAYDPLGRTSKIWQPGRTTTQTPTTEYRYTDNGTTAASHVETRQLAPNGNTTSTFDIYDGLDRLRQTQSTAPDGKRAIADERYDIRGLTAAESELYNSASAPTGTLVTFTDADVPAQHRYTYDALERPATDELWSRGTRKWLTSHTYDGDRVNTTPPAGATPTTVISDVHGRATALRQYTGATAGGTYDETTYGYDRLDRLTTVTDPATNTWTRSYDRRSRLRTQSDPDTGTTRLDYDNADQLTAVTDSRGEKLATVHDTLGRLTELRDDSPTGALRASWTYDTLRKGLPTSATRHHSGLPYTTAVTGYTDLDDPTGVAVTIPAAAAYGTMAGTYTTGYTYKPDGSVATVDHPAAGGLPAETLTYTYRDSGYLAGLGGADTYLSGVDYHWSGEVKQRHLGSAGKRLRLGTDIDEATGRLVKTQVHTEHPAAPDTWDEQLTELYRHDPGGNVLAVNEINDAQNDTVISQQCFQYDHLRRLTEAWTTTAAQCQTTPTQATVQGPEPYWHSYTYDKTGNRLTDTVHQPTGDITRDYTTPAAGTPRPHTLTKRATRGGGPVIDYTYDPAGNLATRTGPGINDTHTFDAEGLLTALTTTGGVHTYIYDAGGERLIADDPAAVTAYLGATELRREKTTGNITATRYYPDAVRTTTGGLTWTVQNYSGTAQLAVNSATLGVTRRRTTPFGETRGTPPATWPDRKGFVGGTNDASGYTHLGARQYDPTTGRFISADPILDPADPQQLHGYAYANNSPITFHDPDGLRPKMPSHHGSGSGGHAATGGSSRGGTGRSGAGSSRQNIPPPRKSPPKTQEKPPTRQQARQIRAEKQATRADIQHTKNRVNAKRGAQTGKQSQKTNGSPRKSTQTKQKPSGGKNVPKGNTTGKGKPKGSGKGTSQVGRQGSDPSSSSGNPSSTGAKRGPKPKGTGPHNLKIEEVGKSVTDGQVVAGGGVLPERAIATPGGFLGSRRPDVLVERADGSQYGINVGRRARSGAPLKREAEAISDLEGAGLEMHFVPYN